MAAKIQNADNYTTEQLQKIVIESKLLISDSFEAPPIILQIDESVIGTLGNFSASTGKAKSRKTFNLTAIAAAAISNRTILKYKASLPKEKNKVIFIDTEQSKWHCKKVLERIIKLAGMPLDQNPENLIFLSLRPYSPSQRIQIIEYIIKNESNLGLVLIDGVRDLAYDINSPQEATEVITKFMQWTYTYNIHIHTVLHQNKGDNNSRGHLGTELNNKSETVFDISVNEMDKERSIVSSAYIRDRDFEPFAFFINESSLPEIDEEYENRTDGSSNKKTAWNPVEWQVEALKDLIIQVFKISENDSLKYGQLTDGIKNYSGMGMNKAKKFFEYFMANKYIIKEGTKYKMTLEKVV
jgi:hypothetical protein